MINEASIDTTGATSTNLIAETAQSLQYNPTRIYEFVRNSVRFEPYYGAKKGPSGLCLTEVAMTQIRLFCLCHY
jgi:hypothetical protein